MMKNQFDGQRPTRLGTPKNPANIRVQTKKRAKEVQALLDKNGWHGTIEIDRDQPEDVADLEQLQNPVQTRTVETKVGRNAPCPCGSGHKFKKCCGP
jgi:SWIM/SEC-C metal-binding protein